MAPWLPVAEVRLAHRSVPEVEAEERVAGTEHLPERPRFLAWRRPDLNLGNAIAGAEHLRSLISARSTSLRRAGTKPNGTASRCSRRRVCAEVLRRG